jgi:hypothetical protein
LTLIGWQRQVGEPLAAMCTTVVAAVPGNFVKWGAGTVL